MINFIATIAVAYALLVAAVYTFQRNLLYLPDRGVPDLEEGGVPDMRAVSLSTNDGLTLLAWYKEAAPGQPTLVYFSGNAGHIGHRGSKARHYLDAGIGVLLVGYRGYGGNPGSPSEDGLYTDGRAALDFLAATGVGPAQIVLSGESIGTGVAVHLATERAAVAPLGAVVLESPFASMADVAAKHYPFLPVRWLVKDRFESAAKIARVRAPVFVFHGEKDRTIPIRTARELFAAAVEPKESLWIAGGYHNDLYDFDAPAAVIAFLRRRFGAPPGSGSND